MTPLSQYVESQTDYRASSETLARKLSESGSDAWPLLEWLREPAQSALASGPQARLLARVFAEQFEILPGTAVLTPREKVAVEKDSSMVAGSQAIKAQDPILTASPPVAAEARIRLKDKKELATDRVQNPHDPEATYSVKGEGEKKKEHVGYKVQVAETVCESDLAPGEPTRNFICGIATHAALESDEEGSLKMEIEQRDMGMDKPPVQYVDAAYISTRELMKAEAEGRELIGPAPGAASKSDTRFCSDHFTVTIEQRKAICPAGHENSQCSRLEEHATGKVSYRFEWSASACGNCPLRPQCMKTDQKHRTLVVSEHHAILQNRRREQKTEAFKERMKHRNAIEGTQSELVRAHGLRRARYRGLLKARLQNYFGGAACNIKRWLRRAAWELKTGLTTLLNPAAAQ